MSGSTCDLWAEGQQTDLSDQLFYGTTTITVPMGMGYRRSLARDWSMTAEVVGAVTGPIIWTIPPAIM